ncbi:tyrosine-protein kinase family protein [Vibrio alfacsensis]|uniref:tyrosine-protein kinase family protein n=1 Tax=Vibrio alfacsensis TaxID=1074311 RepID=UPI001BF004F3|nr:chromosome partitioning protein ParA [Vibrio alfacsensis]BBM64721.1 chromosome partitioning ATPase [Vibrio alfacsensis]BCN24116.1 chromosome partitioning ATPase [Vibrio alfacsensis]
MTMSSTLVEVEQLFIQLELKCSSSVCVTADKSGAGATSLAMALTERYLLSGYRTLYVDFNLFNPSFQTVEVSRNETVTDYQPVHSLNLIEHKRVQKVFAGFMAPPSKSEQMPFRAPLSLQTHLATWLETYDRVVFDTSPLAQCNQSNIPTTVVANQCDATILVVAAQTSSNESVLTALNQLEANDCPFVGIALNQFRTRSLSEDIMSSPFFYRTLPRRIQTTFERFMSKYALFQQAT